MVIFDSTVKNVNRISPHFGQGVAPAPKPAPSTPPSAPWWDRESQTWHDPIATADRQWWAYETFKAEIEAADREQAQLDAHIDRLHDEWMAKEAMYDECLMGRV